MTSNQTTTPASKIPTSSVAVVTPNIHPIYQHMMDDRHLIDTCNEAQLEIASLSSDADAAANVDQKQQSPQVNASTSMLTSTPNIDNLVHQPSNAVENARAIGTWISYMRINLRAVTPKRAHVLRMDRDERHIRLQEQAKVREYIAAYDPIVKQAARNLDAANAAAGFPRCGRRHAGKRLMQRFVRLLLAAIEAQCLLEGYPAETATTTTTSTTVMAMATTTTAPTVVSVDVHVNGDGDDNGDAIAVPVEESDDYGSDYDYDESDDAIDELNNESDNADDGMPAASLRDEILAVLSPEELDIVQSISSTDDENNQSCGFVDRLMFDASTELEDDDEFGALLFEEQIEEVDEQRCENIGRRSNSSSGLSRSASAESLFSYDCDPFRRRQYYCIAGINDHVHISDDNISTTTETTVSQSSDTISNVASDAGTNNSDSNFLLGSQTRRLPMSHLKHIDDAFGILDAKTNGIEWVEGLESPPIELQHTLGLVREKQQTVAATEQPIANPVNHSGSHDRPSCHQNHIQQEPDVSMVEILTDIEKLTNNLSAIQQQLNDQQKELDKPLRRTARRSKKSTPPPPPPQPKADTPTAAAEQPDDTKLRTLLESNVTDLRPDQLTQIVHMCRNHAHCLGHVLVNETLLLGVRQLPQMVQPKVETDGDNAQRSLLGTCAARAAGNCYCVSLVRFVQGLSDFVYDYANAYRYWRLYRAIVWTVAELYGMVRYFGQRLAYHRQQRKMVKLAL